MLNPGSETDLAVAKACGIDYVIHDGLVFRGRMLLAGIPEFRPSTDLNDAFYAALACGLFSEFSGILRFHWKSIESGEWQVEYQIPGTLTFVPLVASGSTPALAICAAILKPREQT